ncbi:thioredoxin domain-containing protein [Wolbachia endosymbiont of Dirofilaria (Dirofilaria) immitis]|uniref:hypothetical protein n=1 Tax=Wolbachia endosymbiont of Dirofilaria (Dirofilaria) immitis TaxID=1812115 RepID=UPI001FE6A75B|nr:hypothetical protein [Wolbachia endosymbiont of Dirofilaria (Dirofilaria) immitis]
MGEFSNKTISNIMKNIWINESGFDNSMKNNVDKIEQAINNSKLLVKGLEVGDTPFLIIGDSLFVGVD